MGFWWHVLLLYHQVVQVAAVSSTSTAHTHNDAICPSRTANYLTHTLAQQCLASSRAAASTQIIHSESDSVTSDTGEFMTSSDSSHTYTSSTQISSLDASQDPTGPTTTQDSSGSQSAAITVTATQVSNQELGPVLPEIVEEESPLESGNFLSFEEWKKQNLQKAGQSEHIGRDAKVDSKEGRKRQPNVQNSLDSLGDDVEIDLDFSGFVPGGPEKSYERVTGSTDTTNREGQDGSAKPQLSSGRKKDAGTTCKERFNYASFDCAASMLKTNPQAKSPGSVLNENKDAYMLNECSAENKFLIVELCHDILVDTVVLANFEFFSSIFRTFRVSVSDRYPAKPDKWKSLGIFEARNSREVQAFLVENPMIWARYLRVEFLTHYGSEFYCPVSLLRVHGTTMLEEYKHDMDNVAEEYDEDSETTETTAEEERLVPEAVDQSMLAEDMRKQESSKSETEDQHTDNQPAAETAHPVLSQSDRCPLTEIPANATLGAETMFFTPVLDVCSVSDAPEATVPNSTIETSTTAEDHSSPTATSSTGVVTSTSTITVESPTATQMTSAKHTESEAMQTASNMSLTDSIKSAQSQRVTTDIAQMSQVVNITESAKDSTSLPSEKKEAAKQTSQELTSTERAKPVTSSSSEKVKQPSSATQPAPASPTMQESFFKSVQKRLQMLESNSSLSLQYIEEQSRALRDAFRKVEQRQLSKTSIFLDHLNSTVLKELREFRQQYDQLWQSTVIELEMQRERYQRENQAMHARLGVLADELIFQKRMSILQMTFILICLGLVLFSRGAINNYLELPLVQSVLSKSPSTRWMNLSGDSPSNPRKFNRVQSAFQMGPKPNGILKGHHRVQSSDSNITDSFSQAEIYSPPTPVSFDGYSDGSHIVQDEGKLSSDPEFDPEAIERPSTSPPTLLASSDPTTPRLNDNPAFSSLSGAIVSNDVSEDSLLPGMSNLKTRQTSPSKQLKWRLPELDG